MECFLLVGPHKHIVWIVLRSHYFHQWGDAAIRMLGHRHLPPAGGTSMLTGLRDRLERELSNAAPHTAKVKVTSPSNALERRFSTWIGMRLLAGIELCCDCTQFFPGYCSEMQTHQTLSE